LRHKKFLELSRQEYYQDNGIPRSELTSKLTSIISVLCYIIVWAKKSGNIDPQKPYKKEHPKKEP